jgi:3-oxoacyl-[acyl-carrier-protein] synthase II
VKDAPDVVVTGIGLVSALGSTALTTWQNLLAGKSAIAPCQPFLDLPLMPLAMIGAKPCCLSDLTEKVVRAAWIDAGLEIADNGSGFGADCGVVIGSSRSHLAEWEAMSQEMAGDWLGALPHEPALSAARWVQSKGPLLAPMAACATGIWAIAQAADLIRTGQCQRVVAGAVEAPITPLTLAGFGKMGALATTGCYPFDRAREGFVLGEGGAVLVLESADLAAQRKATVYGQILAAGLTNDSYHVSSFDPSYCMGRRAVELCLQRSKLSPHQVDALHMHGTSTAQNDRMEASLIAQIFGREIAVMATKGATGHTLGASGAMTVALSLIALKSQRLLPCVGLRQAGFDLNFVRRSQAAQLRTLLCFSFGFGGQNAVLALRHCDWPT